MGSQRNRSVFCSCYISGYILRFLRKTRTMKTPFDNSNLFSSWCSLRKHSDPFLLRLLISSFFFSPSEIKTILSQKHKFCSAVAEPASVTPSGRHQMGHCLLFSPSKLQLRENKSQQKTLTKNKTKNAFHILF